MWNVQLVIFHLNQGLIIWPRDRLICCFLSNNRWCCSNFNKFQIWYGNWLIWINICLLNNQCCQTKTTSNCGYSLPMFVVSFGEWLKYLWFPYAQSICYNLMLFVGFYSLCCIHVWCIHWFISCRLHLLILHLFLNKLMCNMF